MKTITRILFSACKPYQMLKIFTSYLQLSLAISLFFLSTPYVHAQLGQLFWTDGALEQISTVDLDGSNRMTILEDLNEPAGIDIDRVNSKLYWVDRAANRIQRSNLDGSNIETILSGLTNPVGIAVDPLNQLIFWSERSVGRISKVGFDGSNQEELLNGLNNPIGLALGNGKLYFTAPNFLYETDTTALGAAAIEVYSVTDGLVGVPLDLSYNTNTDELFWVLFDRIQKADADGMGTISNVRTAISPTGIDLDLSNSLIYYSDATNNSIKSMDIAGTTAPVDIVSGPSFPLNFPLGIVSDANFIYWVDVADAAVERADLMTGNNPITLIEDFISTVRGIALDGANSKFYWVDDGLDKILRANLDGSMVEEIVNTGLVNPVNLALDLVNGHVFWTDASNQTISRADLAGTNQNITVVLDNTDGLMSPNGIALDLTENRIYWSDLTMQTISRADLDGNNIEEILDNGFDGVTSPQGIAVDVDNDKIYWADGGGFIGEANTNGTDSDDTFITGITNPVSVVVNPVFGKIFYGTTGSGGNIRSANLDGSADAVFLNTNIDQPNGLAVDAQLALPVSLSFFDGKRLNPQEIQLIWQTASENDNLGFEIQRSYDGQTFDRLAFVDGRGTFFGISDYSYLISEDQSAFYRLKQIDLNGSSTFSPVLFIEGSDQALALRLFPNPGNGKNLTLVSNISLPQTSLVQLLVYTLQGKLILQTESNWDQINQALQQEATLVPQGIYLLEVQVLNQKHSLKWIKN